VHQVPSATQRLLPNPNPNPNPEPNTNPNPRANPRANPSTHPIQSLRRSQKCSRCHQPHTDYYPTLTLTLTLTTNEIIQCNSLALTLTVTLTLLLTPSSRSVEAKSATSAIGHTKIITRCDIISKRFVKFVKYWIHPSYGRLSSCGERERERERKREARERERER
jgi:hypothetical protein